MVCGGAIAPQRQQQQREDLTEYLPPGNGKTLVAKQCSGCHDLRGTIQLRKSRVAWEAVVVDMVARGAPLMIEEVDPIVSYLADAFGPTAPPLVDVNTANKDDLVKLPGVSPAAADQLIAHRTGKGLLTSRDEVRNVLGLDATAFEKIRYYMRIVAGR